MAYEKVSPALYLLTEVVEVRVGLRAEEPLDLGEKARVDVLVIDVVVQLPEAAEAHLMARAVCVPATEGAFVGVFPSE